MHFSQVILKTLLPLQEIEFKNKSNDHQICFFFVLMSSQIELVTEWMTCEFREREWEVTNTANNANQ